MARLAIDRDGRCIGTYVSCGYPPLDVQILADPLSEGRDDEYSEGDAVGKVVAVSDDGVVISGELELYRLINNIGAMHRGCTFLIRKVQDTSAQLPDVRPSTQVA